MYAIVGMRTIDTEPTVLEFVDTQEQAQAALDEWKMTMAQYMADIIKTNKRSGSAVIYRTIRIMHFG